MPTWAIVLLVAVVTVMVLLAGARLVVNRRTQRRIRKVEEGREAGVLPPDVAQALDQASRRASRRADG